DGEYLADTGFGGCLLDSPLLFKTGAGQHTAMGTYQLSESEGLFALSVKRPDGWRTMYVFNLEPQLQSDFELGTWYTSTTPLVPLTSRLMMERVRGGKRYKLLNRRLIIEGREGMTELERSIGSAADLGQILDETFLITPPAPAEEIFIRISG